MRFDILKKLNTQSEVDAASRPPDCGVSTGGHDLTFIIVLAKGKLSQAQNEC